MRMRYTDIIRLLRFMFALLISMGISFAWPSILRAKQEVECQECKPVVALPSELCRVKPLAEWDEPEKWAWWEICAGLEADFNSDRRAKKLNPQNPRAEVLDPNNPNKWSYDNRWSEENTWADGRRTLRSSFLKTILLHEPFRSAVPHLGIRIVGAYFKDEIDLRSASIERPLALENSFFKSLVLMRRLTTPKFVSFSGSRFDNWIAMDSASIGGDLFMNIAGFLRVNLEKIKVGGHLHMKNSIFDGELDLSYASIGGDLSMSQVNFKHAYSKVYLYAARINGTLTMSYSKFEGMVDMSSTSIGRDLHMWNVRFDEPTNLSSITVGSDLDVRGARLRGLDLTDARIKRDLLLGLEGYEKIVWESYKDKNRKSRNPKLTLRNASAGRLQDTKDTWPDKTINDDLGIFLCTEIGTLPCTKKSWTDETKQLDLELDGFTYMRLGAEEEAPNDRKSKWFIEWLARDKSYSPQPYRHLAGVLRAAGYEWRADNILYAGRAREHKESNMWWYRSVFLWVLWLLIGYGYGLRNFFALAWIFGFIIIGMIFLRHIKNIDKFFLLVKKKITRRDIPTRILFTKARSWKRVQKLGFWYSFDMLLPVIRLREKHYGVDLKGWVQYYFYVHKIIGYVLIFFVIAGLTGLTK